MDDRFALHGPLGEVLNAGVNDLDINDPRRAGAARAGAGGDGAVAQMAAFARGILLELVDEVPFVSLVLGYALPEGGTVTPEDLEKRLLEFQESIQGEMEEGYAARLKGDFLGVANVARNYYALGMGEPDKCYKLTCFVSAIEELEAHFVISQEFNRRSPYAVYKTLPLLVALGTLKLVALRERLDNFQVLLGKDPSAERRETEMAAIRATIQTYSARCEEAIPRIVEWRDSHIGFKSECAGCPNTELPGCSDTTWYKAWDKYGKTDAEQWSRSEHMTIAPFVVLNANAPMDVYAAFRARRCTELGNLSNRLWRMLAPTRMWPGFDSDEPLTLARSERVDTTWSGFFGSCEGTAFEDKPQDRPITAISLSSHEGRVGSLEVSYFHAPTGLRGQRFKNETDVRNAEKWLKDSATTLKLGADEVITTVTVQAGAVVGELVFQTSEGREIRAGGGSGSRGQQPHVMGGAGCQLVAVGGYEGEWGLNAIRFGWRSLGEVPGLGGGDGGSVAAIAGGAAAANGGGGGAAGFGGGSFAGGGGGGGGW